MVRDLPRELTLVRDFVNTIDVEEGTDGLEAWLSEQVGRTGPPFAEDDIARARALRDALRRLLASHHDGGEDPAALERLDALGRAVPLRIGFASSSALGLEPATDGPRAVLGRVLAGAVVARATGTWERLKLCPADDCQWAFYDQSKNRSRRWCSMQVCGNRDKTRAYRERCASS